MESIKYRVPHTPTDPNLEATYSTPSWYIFVHHTFTPSLCLPTSRSSLIYTLWKTFVTTGARFSVILIALPCLIVFLCYCRALIFFIQIIQSITKHFMYSFKQKSGNFKDYSRYTKYWWNNVQVYSQNVKERKEGR